MKIGNNANVLPDQDICFGSFNMISALKKALKIVYPTRSVEDLDSVSSVDVSIDTISETIDAVIRESKLLSTQRPELDFIDESAVHYVSGYVLRKLNVQKNFCSNCLEFLVSSEDAAIIMSEQSQ